MLIRGDEAVFELFCKKKTMKFFNKFNKVGEKTMLKRKHLWLITVITIAILILSFCL